MKTFKQHLTEAATSAAFEMERVIVSAAGGPSYTAKDKKISPDAGEKIVKNLNLTGKGAMPKNAYDVTPDWASYFPGGKAPGATKTPKTDFLIGTRRISLKTGSGAQLMSGGKSEATATFYAACSSGNIPIDGAIKKLESQFNSMMSTTVPNVKGNARELVKNQKSELINKTNKIHEEFKKDLRSIFSKNKEFAYHFTFEAMTGVQKFGQTNVGAAQYFLVTDWTGDQANVHDAFKDKGYVKKISSRVVPEARFKSGSQKKVDPNTRITKKTGFYSIYSAVGLGLKNMQEELDTIEGDLLTEAVLDKIKRVYNKFVTYIKKMLKKVIAYIGNNWQRLIQFLNLEPQISFNNTPTW